MQLTHVRSFTVSLFSKWPLKEIYLLIEKGAFLFIFTLHLEFLSLELLNSFFEFFFGLAVSISVRLGWLSERCQLLLKFTSLFITGLFQWDEFIFKKLSWCFKFGSLQKETSYSILASLPFLSGFLFGFSKLLLKSLLCLRVQRFHQWHFSGYLMTNLVKQVLQENCLGISKQILLLGCAKLKGILIINRTHFI